MVGVHLCVMRLFCVSLFCESHINVVSRSFVTAQCGLQFSSRGMRPSATTMMARHLDQNTMGYLQWRWGTQSTMTTSIVRDTKTSHFTLALQVKPMQGYTDDGNSLVQNKVNALRMQSICSYACSSAGCSSFLPDDELSVQIPGWRPD